MSDHDSNAPEWASDPAVAGWLGTPDPAPPGEGSDVVAAEQDSPPEQRPTDDSVWAHNPAVAQWLDTPPPPDRGEDTVAAPDAAPPPVAGTGYDADATIQMAPITDTSLPERSAVPPSPPAPAAAGMATTAQVPGFYPSPTPTGRRLRRPQRRTAVMASAVAVAAVLVLGLVIATFVVIGGTSDDGDGPVAQPPPPPVLSQFATTAEDADCPNRTDGAVTTGRDPGGTTSGPAAIKAFEYAYFVQRSGVKAREVVAPLAAMPTTAQIQSGIDTDLSPGTRHCLKITDRTGGVWGVELTMLPPAGAAPQVLHLVISTAVVEGRHVITAMTKDTTQ